MKETVICFCAHSDDQIFGPGGTLAKYAKEGIKVITVIFSYGQLTHPHLKEEVIISTRVNESIKANDLIGGDQVLFFGLSEGKFTDEAKDKKVYSKIKHLLQEYNPSKLFIHSLDDLHPDHKAVYEIVTGVVNAMNFKGAVYAFDVWTPFNFRKREEPKLYVDITSNFKTKIKALRLFESQKIALYTLLWSVYVRAIVHGIEHGCRFAERFYKIK